MGSTHFSRTTVLALALAATAASRAAHAQATEPRECQMAAREHAAGASALANMLDQRCALRRAQLAQAAQRQQQQTRQPPLVHGTASGSAAAPAPAAAAPAPAPAPAGAPGTGPATTAPSASTDWANELPTVAAVKQAVTGSAPTDTEARQEAAFAVLNDYIEQRSGPRYMMTGLPPALSTHFEQYSREQSRKHPNMPRSVSSAAEPYFEDPAFRDQTLAKLLSPGSVAAYDATSGMQELKANRKAVVQAAADDATVRALLGSTLEAAHKGGTDLSVFGVTLGEALNLPPCPTTDTGTSLMNMLGGGTPVEQTCRASDGGGAGGLFGMFDQVAITGALGPDAPGIENVNVRLAASRCPDWAACQMIVATYAGYALAATFLTEGADKQNQVEGLLTSKYHHAPTSKDTFSECKQSYRGIQLGTIDRAAVRIWSLPGLLVGYVPYGSVTSCANGGVRVQTRAYGELVQRANQGHLDAQPKM